MKQRITGLDLQILTSELSKELSNYRLQNIYNVASNSRQYLFKFSIPDSKKVVVLEYGNRIHLTDFERPTTQQPTNFVTKLRKHLKTRRLSGIKQISNDRILVLEFSDGKYYLVLEFFSAGNILLLDESQRILALQRLVSAKQENDRYAVNEEYKMFDKSLFQQDFHYEKRSYDLDEVESWIQTHKLKLSQNSDNKKAKVFSIHKLAFINASHLSGELIQKWFFESGIDPSQSCLSFEKNQEALQRVVNALGVCEDKYIDLINGAIATEGYIVAKKNNKVSEKSDLEYIYDEFHPFEPYKPNQEGIKFISVSGYNKTLDKFFSNIESTKFSMKIEQQKENAAKRLEKARSERDKQIDSLVAQQRLNAKKGELIQYHSELVEECRSYVQSFIDQQMDWTNIETVISLEQKKKNELAQHIQLPLNLKENKIKVLFEDFDDYEEKTESESESSSESESDNDEDKIPVKRTQRKTNTKEKPKRKTIPTWIDLSQSAFANARSYFDSKKTAETKQVKVENSTSMALKNAERKITQDLTRSLKQENDTLKEIRPKYWFEKFFGLHFSDNDSIVSADMEGSLKVFIKNPLKGEALPPSTLMQAVTTSAWVLHGTEISKRDFDGSIVPEGEFNYLVQKEYLPPAQLIMGFGFYCLLDDESTKRYGEIRTKRELEHGFAIVVDNKKKELEEIRLAQKASAKENTAQEQRVDESSESDDNEDDGGEDADSPDTDTVSVDANGEEKPNQDEEERKLRMDALGTLKQVEERLSKTQIENSEKSELVKKQQQKEVILERKKKQKERELQKYLLGDDNNDEETNNESHIVNYLEILDSFTAKPSTKDTIVGLVPVFAPWSALQKFKYKVKIQPGSGKKGKCIGDSINHFVNRKMDSSSRDVDLDWPQEREFINNFKTNDIVGIFTVGKVKLVLPGGSGDSNKSGKSNNKKPASKKGNKKK
ncbi:hypothetical protein FOB64_000961 [Candida albicans]|uniref:Ribosome quality control complex subunit 2 n=1 Tax=Candida albicans TaxID=5476 RepID=A0A8H6F5D1_CANAX|nr:hypothetical protein FOB64_000961 [Candida albicans]